MSKQYKLTKFIIRYTDYENGQKTILDHCTICESYPRENYLTNDESFFEKWENLDKSRYDDAELIEVELCLIDEEQDKETMCLLFQIDTSCEYQRNVYSREQHYGGAEEGGWYYHTQELTDYKPEDVGIGTNPYGEGFIIEHELYRGQNENLRTQYYC
jgi:hypothetical protein